MWRCQRGRERLRVGDHMRRKSGRLNSRTEEGRQAGDDNIPLASICLRGKRTSTPSRRPTSSSTSRADTEDLVNAPPEGNFVLVNRTDVDYIDVSPKQLVSLWPRRWFLP